MAKILVVDDDALSLEFINIFLESEGHTVAIAVNLSEAFEAAKLAVPDILITDLNLGEESGQDVIKHVKELNKSVKTIVITGYDKNYLHDQHIEYDHLVTKPVDLNELQKLLQS